MYKNTQVMARLMAGWNGMVIGGLMTYEDLRESLTDQVNGIMDMSADELDADMAGLMGWDIDRITEEQYDIWRDLVNQTARKYLG